MFVLIAVLIVLVDQLTKFWVVNNLPYGETIPILGNVFSLNYIHNEGAAFSILTGKIGLLSIISIVVVLVVAVIWYRTPKEQKIWRFAYALLIGGALGNWLDRIRLGYVVDFLRFPNFPVFNVADCMLVGSVILICLLVLLDFRKESKANKQNQ